MQRIADKVFLLTPRNVEVSAEERARLIEKGFFNQSLSRLSARSVELGFRARCGIGLIGAGNMAGALARGWASPCCARDVDAERARRRWPRELGGEAARLQRASWPSAPTWSSSPQAGAARARWPRRSRGSGEGRRRRCSPRTPLATLARGLPRTRRCFRFMPNIAAEVAPGRALLRAGPTATPTSSSASCASCSAASATVVAVPTSALMDVATAIVGRRRPRSSRWWSRRWSTPACGAACRRATAPRARASRRWPARPRCSRARDGDTLALRRAVTSPGGVTAAGCAALEERRPARGLPDAPSTRCVEAGAMTARSPSRARRHRRLRRRAVPRLHDPDLRLHPAQLVFSFGARMPYNRAARTRSLELPARRDRARTCGSSGASSRRWSGAARPQPDRRDHRAARSSAASSSASIRGLRRPCAPAARAARAGAARGRSWSLDQVDQGARASTRIARGEQRRRDPRPRPRQRAQHGRRVRLLLGRRRRWSCRADGGGARAAARATSRAHRRSRWLWLPTGLLLGGALGNLVDRVARRRGDRLHRPAAVAGVQRRRHARSRSACCRCCSCSRLPRAMSRGDAAHDLRSRPGPPATRLDAFLAEPLGLARARRSG